MEPGASALWVTRGAISQHHEEPGTMLFKNRIARALVAGLSLIGAATIQAQTTATGEPKVLAGSVTIKSTQVAFLISGKAGGGTLKFQGKEYAFTIGGLGIGGIGVQKIDAEGKVYNLTDVAKFPGTYVQARAGATVGQGKGAMSLSNQHGVIMELRFGGEGIALSVGADGMIVSMK
jgi:hypothetical protein